jgi:hypothetical protein
MDFFAHIAQQPATYGTPIHVAVVADRIWISNAILRHISKRQFSFFALFQARLASKFTKSDNMSKRFIC